MNLFNELCNKYGTDKGTEIREKHNYSLTYEKLFSGIRLEKLNILEIGIADPMAPGASLRVFSEYFPNSILTGFDIVDCTHFNIDRATTIQGDASNVDDIRALKKYGPYNIIIDDGAHIHEHHMLGFRELFTSLAEKGMYIIEDLHADGIRTKEYFLDDKNKQELANVYGLKRVELYNDQKVIILYNY